MTELPRSDTAVSQTSFDQSCQDLFALLRRRRNDPAFWEPLTELLQEIVQGATSPRPGWRPPPYAKLLGAWDAEQLARRLQDALSASEPEAPGADDQPSRLAEMLSPALVATFLLLGMAASACGDGGGDGTGGAGGTAGAGGRGALWTGGTGGQAGSGGAGGWTCTIGPSTKAPPTTLPTNCSQEVGSALWNAIDQACLDQASKEIVYSCLSNMRSSWCDGLTALFANGSPERIATVLGELARCCPLDRVNPDTQDYTMTLEQQLVDGMYCYATVYKGVSFPD
jgi:hypothetical protein